jgi:hypothetical protein
MQIEGVDYEVSWKQFKRGTSMFFPCLDYDRAREELKPVLRRLSIKVLSKGVIENGIRGLRIWRM